MYGMPLAYRDTIFGIQEGNCALSGELGVVGLAGEPLPLAAAAAAAAAPAQFVRQNTRKQVHTDQFRKGLWDSVMMSVSLLG